MPFNLNTEKRGQEKQKVTKEAEKLENQFKAKAMPTYKFFEVKREESNGQKKPEFNEFDLKTRDRSL